VFDTILYLLSRIFAIIIVFLDIKKRSLSNKKVRFATAYHARAPQVDLILKSPAPTNRDVFCLPSLTKRKHIPTYLFKQADELQQIYPKLVESLENINAFNAGKKRDEALSFLAKHLPKLTKFSAQIKRTNEYIRDLEEAKKDLESAVAEQDAQLFEMEYTVRNLNHEQKKVKDLLKKIPAELLTELTKNEKTR